jgi:hypothetical protein
MATTIAITANRWTSSRHATDVIPGVGARRRLRASSNRLQAPLMTPPLRSLPCLTRLPRNFFYAIAPPHNLVHLLFRTISHDARRREMSFQTALFHDSIYDAIAADVNAIGGVKKVAAMLWPANSDAASRLRACLSTEHPQKLDAEELLSIKRMARDVGSSATLNYEAQELSFNIEWISPEDEKARLQREVLKMGERFNEILRRLQK